MEATMATDSVTRISADIGLVPTTVSPPPFVYDNRQRSPQTAEESPPTFPRDEVHLSAAAIQRLQEDQANIPPPDERTAASLSQPDTTGTS